MVTRQLPQRYAMRNVVFKPGEKRSDLSGGSVGRALAVIVFFVFVLPFVFAVALLIGGEMMLAVLTVVVVGVMGYLVLSIFN